MTNIALHLVLYLPLDSHLELYTSYNLAAMLQVILIVHRVRVFYINIQGIVAYIDYIPFVALLVCLELPW